jgi:hypothetical protein
MASFNSRSLYSLRHSVDVVERLFGVVNAEIAPAKLVAVYPSEELRGVMVKGQWGTLRFSFTIGEEVLDLIVGGPDAIAQILIRHTAKAVDNALAALVEAEVHRQLVILEARMKKYADHGFGVVQAELDKRPVPRLAWYRRLWTRLNKPL